MGPGASIQAFGSTNVWRNDLELVTDLCPPGQFGIYYYGPNAIQVPFGNGFRCVGGPIHRLVPATHTGSGTATRPLDFEAPPMDSGAGAVVTGATWNFQFWYRDVPAGGAFFNLSDGLSVTFCP